ncbi:MlaE family lipid ABC transporter permease subunit [Novosphingobium sp.]|uniref:ABC transporter permease n=1 Tax=Novosphingobium sp. TaxID=1874826 RepID=UPI003B5288B9
MTQAPDFTLNHGENGDTLALTGSLLVSTVGMLDRRLRAVEAPVATLDLGGVTAIDTVGAWVCLRTMADTGAKLVNADDIATRLIEALGKVDDRKPVEELKRLPVWLRVPQKIGEAVVEMGTGAVGVVGFVGEMVLSIGPVLLHPTRVRWRALVHQMELVGVNALAIVGLMSFLVGIVITQQGAAQLRQFGAEIYTVNLVGRLTLRELGILMTAIMVAGRSGSAFAAELGTMKLTEEVDAMRTIGVGPMEVLILPRIMATVIMMPLLGIYSAVLGMIGGAFLAQFTLHIPFLTFLLRIREVVPTYDIWVGLIKGPVFGLIVALAGCYQGMQVRDNAEEVGKRTTAAVVLAIFTVIVLDAFFAVFFTEVGWA